MERQWSELEGLCAVIGANANLEGNHDVEAFSSEERRRWAALPGACATDGVKLVWAGTEVGNAQARRAFEGTGAGLEGEKYAEYEWEIA